ncbi:signal peptidase I [Anaerotignum propionicum]|uniref:Signal peptidase I n=1 Tax=Anaerotignum propionicum DSM 1682 TaxID=991789 RepID=A0A0X8V818_ANAPI|nr:signal peptidase I [Anaerotignum propionicum]AMJ39802.1 signal peptidase I S [Anaerotignum propionicum DSM 1682]SHE28346.1 signal peptidase I . Serine peptidase. MEROPS family S26A [[Clostridium] propionicum DSM 1682] [Anaerotignum propionicum DSM 1682]
MSNTAKKEIISWVKTILLAVVLAGAVNTLLIVNAQVPTGSMETTIMTGDRILALRTSYWFNQPERGDVVVFRYPDDPEQKTLYVKRIIGMGGDVIKVENGNVYVNGEALDEPYLEVVTQGTFGPFEVPEGSFFMMGDNRNDSWDSRFWDNKFVAPDKILGKVVFRYYKGFKWIS